MDRREAPVERPIPMLDLGAQIDQLWPELEKTVREVMRSGRFILGPQVEAFERECASYLGCAHTIGVGSGHEALVIALRAAGIGPGDEVITTPFTFFSTGEATLEVGATPVFADIEPDSFCLDPESALAALTPRTRAFLPVHLYGAAADLGPLLEVCAQRGLKLIEDTAQAFGATCAGKRLGTLGSLGAFSFFPSKSLGAFGDAGLIATNDAALAEQVRLLRHHGQRDRYTQVRTGRTGRLDELQAAILRVKLPYMERWNARRRAIAERYRSLLAGAPQLVLPSTRPDVEHSYNYFTLRILGGRRDAVQQELEKRGVSTAIYYPQPLHESALYTSRAQRMPHAERAAAEVLSLPIWPEMPDDAVERVAREVRASLGA
jgi:dTDP-4-amino-4,6-dideoxygalactose transaminase